MAQPTVADRTRRAIRIDDLERKLEAAYDECKRRAKTEQMLTYELLAKNDYIRDLEALIARQAINDAAQQSARRPSVRRIA